MAATYCRECGTKLEQREAFGQTRGVCPSCGFVHFDDPKVAVGVIIEIDGGIVLGRRAHQPKLGLWSFPSGFVNAGEVLEDAAMREVEEETGLKVRIDRLIGAYSTRGNRVVFIAYAGTAIGGELVAGEECYEVGTFPLDALPPLAFENETPIIEGWSQGRAKPAASA